MMENNHDAALTRRFNLGDSKAFREIFDCHYQLLYFFVRKLTDDAIEAEDIVLVTFQKLWVRRANFENLANIKAFIYITARNSGIDYLRSVEQRKEAEKALVAQTAISEEEMDRKIVAAELIKEVLDKIDDLPEKARRILLMHFQEGLSLKEIAAKLNITQEDVRVTKFRALEILRKFLDPKRLLPVTIAMYLFFN
jgi:RNA polymerase sigma-70 factor (family 1)